MKNNCFVFERLFKLQKNGVFLFGMSFSFERINENANFFYTYCDYNFNPCGMMSFTKFSTKIWNNENSVAP